MMTLTKIRSQRTTAQKKTVKKAVANEPGDLNFKFGN